MGAHSRHCGQTAAYRGAVLILSLLLLVPTQVRGADPKSGPQPATASSEAGGTIQVQDGPGGWTTSATLSEEPNPAQFSSPFTFPDGKGYYEFYSKATDMAGNEESPPPTADATIQKR